MKKRVNLINRVSALGLSFFLALGLNAPAFSINARAEAIEVLNSGSTVADMIFSYCASGGVAVMNETVINEVYNELGTSYGTLQTFVNDGLLTYSNGQYVDTGLSTNISSAISNINSIDIGSLFSQTAQQNPAGVALTGAGSLAGICGAVASTGFLPIAAGIAIEGWAGFQLGTLIANAIGLYDKNIVTGLQINSPNDVLDRIPDGMVCCSYHDSEGDGSIIYGPVTVLYNDGTYDNIGIYNPSNSVIEFKKINIEDGSIITGEDIAYCGSKNSRTFVVTPNRFTYNGVANYFDNINDFRNAVSSWANGTSTPEGNYSPDLIGVDGNLKGSFDANNNQYTVPDVIPQADPNTQSINPSNLSVADWLNYANAANQNSNNGNPSANTQILQDILDAIRINTPTPIIPVTPVPDPDPDLDPNPNPDPETVPDPVINPYPDTYPVADPETVPDNKPQPEYTEKQTENETDITEGDPYTTPNLLDKFPFCIPRDILRAFKKLDSGSREAPHIQWRFHPNENIDHTFDIDFAVWENIASLLRLLELIAFIVALGIATRNLILS